MPVSVQHSGPLIILHASIASEAPAIGAKAYIQSDVRFRETMAGPRDRAGFMEAPVMGPANIAANPTTEPTAMPP